MMDRDHEYEAGLSGAPTYREQGQGGLKLHVLTSKRELLQYMQRLNDPSFEWEDSRMDREHGAKEVCEAVKQLDFKPSGVAFDAAFESEN